MKHTEYKQMIYSENKQSTNINSITMKPIHVFKILGITLLFSSCVTTKKFEQYKVEVGNSLSQIKQKIDDIEKRQTDLIEKQSQIWEKVDKNNSDLNSKISTVNEQITKSKNDIDKQFIKLENESSLIKKQLDVVKEELNNNDGSNDNE